MATLEKQCSQCGKSLRPAEGRCRDCGTHYAQNQIQIENKKSSSESSLDSGSSFDIDEMTEMIATADAVIETPPSTVTPVTPPQQPSRKSIDRSSSFDLDHFEDILDDATDDALNDTEISSIKGVDFSNSQQTAQPVVPAPVVAPSVVATSSGDQDRILPQENSKKTSSPKTETLKAVPSKRSRNSSKNVNSDINSVSSTQRSTQRSKGGSLAMRQASDQEKSDKKKQVTIQRAVQKALQLAPPKNFGVSVPQEEQESPLDDEKKPDSKKKKETKAKPAKPKYHKKQHRKIAKRLESIQFEMDDDSTSTCIDLLKQLGAMENQEVIETIQPFLNDTRNGVPEAAAVALSQTRSLEATEPLLCLLKTITPQRAVPYLLAIGNHGDFRAINPLLIYGFLHPELAFRIKGIIVGFGRSAVPLLIQIAEQSHNHQIEMMVASCLGELQDSRAMTVLSELVTSKSWEVRQQAIEALGLLGDPYSAPVLIQSLSDKRTSIRVASVKALGKLNSPAVLKPLLQALNDPQPEVQVEAALAVGQNGSKKAIPYLKKMTQLGDPQITLAACDSLALLEDASAVQQLVPLLREPESESQLKFQLKVIGVLRSMKETAQPAVSRLVDFLQHEQPDLRRKAIEALGAIGDLAAAESIEVCLLEDADEIVRASSAKALGDLGDLESIEALNKSLEDVMSVRVKSIIAIGHLKQDSSISTLLGYLHDPSPQLRYHSMMALVSIGNSALAYQILPLILDEEEMVKRGAFRALEKLGETRTEKELLKAARKLTKGKKHTHSQTQGSSFDIADLLSTFVPYRLLEIFDPRIKEGQIALSGLVLSAVVLFALVWTFIPSGSSGSLLLRGFTSSIDTSPDGKIVVGRSRGLVEVWTPGTYRPELQVLTGQQAEIKSIVCVSPQLAWYATKTEMGTVSLKDSSIVPVLTMPKGMIFITMRASADKKSIVAIDNKKTIYIYDKVSAKSKGLIRLGRIRGSIQTAVSENSIFVSSKSQTVRQISYAGKTVRNYQISMAKSDVASSIALSPDGTQLAVGTHFGQIYFLDIETGKTIKTLGEIPQSTDGKKQPVNRIRKLLFFPNAPQTLLAISRKTQVWDIASERSQDLPRLDWQNLAISPDGKFLTGFEGEEAPIFVFDIATNKMLPPLEVK